MARREGRLRWRTLSTAVAEINRHSRRKLYIDDPELASRPVIGIFNANDSESFANAAAATFGANVEHVNGEIHLQVKPENPVTEP